MHVQKTLRQQYVTDIWVVIKSRVSILYLHEIYCICICTDFRVSGKKYQLLRGYGLNALTLLDSRAEIINDVSSARTLSTRPSIPLTPPPIT